MGARTLGALVVFGAGVGVLRGLGEVTPGTAHAGHLALVTSIAGSPAVWMTAAIAVVVAGLLVLVLEVSSRRATTATGRHGPCAGHVVEPLLWGMGAAGLALILDVWWARSTALVLAAAGLGLGAAAAARRRRRVGERTGGFRMSPLALAAIAVAVPLALAAPGPPEWPAFSGDEPHYLLYAKSLWLDHDIDLGRDYLDGDYREFHPGRLAPHTKSGLDPGSRFSTHGIGTALWLAPWYGLARAFGLAGAMLDGTLRLAMALWLGAFALVLHALLTDVAGSRAAGAGTLVAVSTTPLLFMAPHVFPDLPALTLSAAAYLLVRRRPGPAGAMASGALVALLPWLGVKFFALVTGLAVAAAFWLRPRQRRTGQLAAGTGWARSSLTAFLLPVVASTLLHVAFTWELYGSVSPLAVYVGAGEQAVRAPSRGGDLAAYLSDPAGISRSAAGLFLDQRTGLFLIAPQYLLAFVGASWLWRNRRRDLLSSLLVLGSYASVYAVSQERTGWSPAGRALVPVLWTLALPLGIGLERSGRALLGRGASRPGRRLAGLRGALLAAGVGLTVLFAAQVPLLYHDYGIRYSLLALSYGAPEGLPLWLWLPLWTGPGELQWGANLAWALAVGCLAVVLWRGGEASGPPPRCPGDDDEGLEPRRGAVVRSLRWAAAVWLAGVGTLMLHHLWVPVSGDQRPRSYGEVSVWTSDVHPKRAWADADGVWFRGPDAVAVPLESRSPLEWVRLEVSTIVPRAMEVGLAVGGDLAVVEVSAGQPEVVELRPSRSTDWAGGRFYTLGLSVPDGLSPARLGTDPEDLRSLGAYVRFLDVRVAASHPTAVLGTH